jgi:hypothetical protein
VVLGDRERLWGRLGKRGERVVHSGCTGNAERGVPGNREKLNHGGTEDTEEGFGRSSD